MPPQLQPLNLLYPEIKELLKERNYTLLKQILREVNPIGFADCWGKFSEEERLQIFSLLPSTSALRVFEILPIEHQRQLLEKLNDENMTNIVESISSPEMAKLFHKLPGWVVNKMRKLIKRQEALAHIDLLMTFPERSAGSLMHPEFIKLGPRLSSKQALALISAIARPGQKEYLFALFVTDDQGKILGALSLQDLLGAPEDEKLSELMVSVEGCKIRPDMDQEEVSQLFAKHDLTAAPVVDSSNRLIGVITIKDIVHVERQEATEDFAKLAGTSATELQEMSVMRTLRYRMPWLVVTLIGELGVSMMIKHYETLLAKVIALAAFSPLIAAMGGNVGSQSTVVVVRSIALGQLNTPREQWKAVFRELRVGILMGISYGLFLGGIAYLMYGKRYGIDFSIAVSAGMTTSMIVACTMGAVGPILLQRVGIDPASATGPLITTTTDMFTNFIYYALAAALLINLYP